MVEQGLACYLDSSALVKLVITESETPALAAFLRDYPRRITSVVAAVEVPRAVARLGLGTPEELAALERDLYFVDLDQSLVAAAATVAPMGLRTLDAIHLATALLLRPDLGALVTYDRRLADAAQAAGLEVVSPS